LSKNKKLNYKNGDIFTKKAKSQGYRSRASFKLIEIDEKDKIFSRSYNVLDLGSYPGGWTQVSLERIGSRGVVVSIDTQDMEPIDGSFYINKDIQETTKKDFNKFGDIIPFDLVLSDMAPNISGISERDDALMIDLLENVLRIQSGYLKNKGHLVVKVFQGESLEFMRKKLKQLFKTVKVRKPISSRSSSREVYLVAMEKI
tara:strand:- start:83121 stop:83723 length:603 start_codon:yes stop_codon:yes gene_type:complete